MPKPLSLRKNFIWTFGGNSFYSLCQWIAFIAITNLMVPEQAGSFALALAISAPIVLFTGMNLRIALASDAKREYAFGHYLALRLITGLLALLVVAILMGTISYSKSVKTLLLAVTLNKLAEDFSSVFYGLFQQHERMDIISKSVVLRGSLGVGIFVGLLFWKHSVLISTAGRACCSIVTLLCYDIRNACRFGSIRPCFNGVRVKQLVIKTFPLGVVMGIMSLKANIPRYFLGDYCSEEMVAYFSAIAFILLALHLPVHALTGASIARLSKYFAEDRRLFRNLVWKLTKLIFLISVIVIAGCWLFGRRVLLLFYPSSYAAYWRVLIVGSVGQSFAFFVSMGSSAFTATRKFHWQILIYALVLVSTIASCYLLIPRYGIMGAAWAGVVSSFIHSLLFLAAVILSLRGDVGKNAAMPTDM